METNKTWPTVLLIWPWFPADRCVNGKMQAQSLAPNFFMACWVSSELSSGWMKELQGHSYQTEPLDQSREEGVWEDSCGTLAHVAIPINTQADGVCITTVQLMLLKLLQQLCKVMLCACKYVQVCRRVQRHCLHWYNRSRQHSRVHNKTSVSLLVDIWP